ASERFQVIGHDRAPHEERRSGSAPLRRLNRSVKGSSGSGLLERLGSARHQGAKGRLIADRQLGGPLAGDLNTRASEAPKRAAVADIVLPAGGVDARDPELAEVALPDAAVAVGILPRVHHRFVGGLERLASVAPVALRGPEYLVVALAGHHPALDSGHGATSS